MSEISTSEFRTLNPVKVEPEPVKQGRSLVVVIGINTYAHWRTLNNAVQDALGLQQALIDKLGFTAPIAPLIDAAATQEAIEALIEEQLHELLKEDDSLVLFFAGHGHTRIAQDSEVGYIIPVDARMPDEDREHWSDYIRLNHWLEEVAELPARHILVILDACHSGVALGSAANIYRSAERFRADISRDRSRKVITSAKQDQLALDGGPVPGHSLFTGTLINGFNWGESDIDGNGFITSSELGLYLQQKVGQASGSTQTPEFGAFHRDEQGEMVISLRNQSFDTLKARALSALQTGQFTLFKELTEQAIALKLTSAETLYLEYRLRFREGNFQRVTEIIDILVRADLQESLIPLSNNDLSKIQLRLPCWAPVLSIPEGEFLAEVTVMTGSTKEQLLVIAPQPFGESQAYLIEPKSFCQLSLNNPTSAPLHIYMVGFDETGRFQLETLWEDEEIIFNGLMPGETKRSFLFAPQGKPGLREIRLFSSPKRLRFFLFPASSDAYGAQIDTISAEDLQQIEMKVIRYSLTNSLLSEKV
ncbi:caspase family protein [Leptolyngbya sp. NIES-2104]|uniref:caspase family protein n=1 Tax=Leptolyngbya sp. NIES-2104 TaxID=1552121 RepID=UPI00073ED119|nr:caspase family protein [Leptolyngbya sp. NIES-2104]